MAKNDPWTAVIRELQKSKKQVTPIEPEWLFYYNDGHRTLLVDHKEAVLDEILQLFEDFCKGCGFVFDGFAIVDEDGIPVNGLNSLAKLEADGNEDTTG
jgi:hypothetical protein